MGEIVLEDQSLL